MDVASRASLQRVVDSIRSTCPPIAGVVNGASGFHDALFSDMSLEEMQSVLGPKVDGTRRLDAIFNTAELDFFIVLSSLTSVIGNSGQSNYTAANAYMTGCISRRRKRGLAGSSLEMGRIAGLGYVERAGDLAREQLIRYGFMAVSEADLHVLLAEANLAGAPESLADPVITTGCRTVLSGEEPRVPWLDDPRLSHKIQWEAPTGQSEDGGSGREKRILPVKDQLAHRAGPQKKH